MKKIITTLIALALIFTLTACTGSPVDVVTIIGADEAQSTTNEETTVSSTAAPSVAEAQAENSNVHDDAEDYVLNDSELTQITLNGSTITVSGNGVSVDGSTATITAAGTYSLSGSLADGQIIVDTTDKATVKLILNGVDLHCSTGAAIYVLNAEETTINLADLTENVVSDETRTAAEETESGEDDPNAAIYSKSDLTIFGDGSLTVNGNDNDGIASKDGLVIASGTITVNAVDDGIRGKDYLVIKGGTISINAQGDGLKADNAEDATKGYISVEAGNLQIAAAGDAMDAETDILIAGGQFTITSGNGTLWGSDTSMKGLKAGVSITIDSGTFSIQSADDALNTNGTLMINGGSFTISSGDDGMHADNTLEINAGDIRITSSYEGLESAVITINAGNIYINASDDGINVAGGADASGFNAGMGPGGRMQPGGGPGMDVFAAASGNYYLYINGGSITVNAAGDGIDSNGSIQMTDGTVIVNGPTENMNGAVDYMGTFGIQGGLFVAVGSAGMAQAPDASSSQASLLLNFSSTLQAGTLVAILNSQGQPVLTFAPNKQYQSLAFSSPDLEQGASYTVYTGGSSSGTATNGLYLDGVYTPGTQYTGFTASSVVTQLGGGGMPGGGGGRPRP